MKIPPLVNVYGVTGKRDTYGPSLRLFEIDKVSEMLEIPELQGKN